ncbi:MAG: accessory Sec system translocase SecA2 [Candidatus Promineifilaceae bacterium]
MIKRLARRLTGNLEGSALQRYGDQVAAINTLETELQRAADEQLRQRATTLKERVRRGESFTALAIELFALVREVAWREVRLRPFDVQLIGGLALYEGKIVQMNTGEGKTLAAVAPIALHALRGSGAHVLTFNDYLARRDAQWMGPIYRALGLTVGFVQEGMSRAERRQAYRADVTYLTAKEAGFDFLRDGLAYDVADLVHRPFQTAVVDEADSILIDEARVPLVIAGLTAGEPGQEKLMRAIVQQLQPGQHYAIDEYGRNVYLTEAGSDRAEALLNCDDLYAPANLGMLTELNLALHAEALMHRDVDYIVRDGRIEIVDDFTGRVVKDRHWPHGLQTAIEAKEGLGPSQAGRVLGSITLQHFLRGYPNLSGMTATAEPAADELANFYNLEVLVIPPNRPCIRIDQPDYVFANKKARQQTLLPHIKEVHKSGRPILVGTTSVAESEELAADLQKAGIECAVLNARRDEQEARIVAEAGALNAVTISTNMAGRGTDIRLGGHQGEDHEPVAALGGLYVIGTNMHESRRIDDQLRGRAGRQGDPGASRFFISLEDELLTRYRIADSFGRRWRSAADAAPVDSAILRRRVAQAQRIVEGQNFDIRQTLWRYSQFVESQRQIIDKRRREILEGRADPGIVQERLPERHRELLDLLGERTLSELERRVMLRAIDECWSDHLARVTEIRDGIHLAEVGGLDPYREFLKLAADSFEQTLAAIDQRALEIVASLEIGSGCVSFEDMGLQGPSSTWTYLVNDQAFTDRLAASLMGGRNVGFAAGAAMTGPLLMLWALSRRFRQRKLHSEDLS